VTGKLQKIRTPAYAGFEKCRAENARGAVIHFTLRRSLQLSICIAAICSGEALMTKCIGAAVLAVTLMFGGSAAIGPAPAAPLPATVQKSLQERQASKAAEFSARRRIRHHHRYADRPYYRPYYPAYYDRPYYYAPAPFFPLPGARLRAVVVTSDFHARPSTAQIPLPAARRLARRSRPLNFLNTSKNRA
jgi:hypothetical protein